MMGAMEKLTVSVPADMAASLRRRVADGDYMSEGEIVREALDNWTQSQRSDEQKLEWLRAAVKAGEESGPGIPAEQVYRELDELIDSYRRQS